ncbi:MAG TPA: hypothetical protein VMS38_20140, partial [Pseudorhodoferax sp.]|nr:hypothetical protein [Pseudorhodoferax sp.]
MRWSLPLALRRARRPRLLAALGLLLLALALAVELGLSAPLRTEQAALQRVVPPAPRGGLAGAERPDARLAQFHAGFPPLDALAAALAELDATARAAGVPLRAAEYRLEQRAEAGADAGAGAGPGVGSLMRYRIALRTAGDYAPLRDFLGRLVERQPYVALDDVQFRRSGEAALEAELRLSVY